MQNILVARQHVPSLRKIVEPLHGDRPLLLDPIGAVRLDRFQEIGPRCSRRIDTQVSTTQQRSRLAPHTQQVRCPRRTVRHRRGTSARELEEGTWRHVEVLDARRVARDGAPEETMSQAIPLTNSSQIASRANQEVRIIGKVQKVRVQRLYRSLVACSSWKLRTTAPWR